jgi:epoxyqueuosine reductase
MKQKGITMESHIRQFGRSRREFIRSTALLGALMLPAPKLLHGRDGEREEKKRVQDRFLYKAKMLSVDRFGEMRKDFEDLKRGGFLSRNERFQGYIKRFNFELPETFKQARSIIVLSVFTRSMDVRFHLNGKAHDIVLPLQYYDDGVTQDDLKNAIRRDVLPDPAFKLEMTTRFPLKLLAVRSGLGRYGRNNLCYVDGMGSYNALYAFFTDAECKRDEWSPLKPLDSCGRCMMCYGICPSGAIRKDPFVIDAGRCVTLYNEVKDPFPKWLRPGSHDALMGCMKCQRHCPENVKVPESSGRLEDVTEEETRKILNGTPDDALLESLKRKLKNFYPVSSREDFPIFTRNLSALIT